MALEAILFDLDDTLLVEKASADEAFLATCTLAQRRYGLNPMALHQKLRQEAQALWHASPERPTIDRISISHWEALWARFIGDDPDITRLRHWVRYYRREAWLRALRAFGQEDAEFADMLSREFRRQRQQRHVLFPGTLPVLQALHGHFKLGLITNGLSCLQHEKIDASGLRPYFNAIIVAGDIGFAKPDPRAFQILLKDLQVSPHNALMVGNSVQGDIGGAQAAGIKAILIDRGKIHGADDTITPDLVIHQLTELIDTVLNLDIMNSTLH